MTECSGCCGVIEKYGCAPTVGNPLTSDSFLLQIDTDNGNALNYINLTTGVSSATPPAGFSLNCGSDSASSREFTVTEIEPVCVNDTGTKTSWYKRSKFYYDGIITTEIIEYSQDGITAWSTTVPTGIIAIGACKCNCDCDVNYIWEVNDATPIITFYGTQNGGLNQSLTYTVVQGTGIVEIAGLSVNVPTGFSQTWQSDNKLALDIIITANPGSRIIVNTVQCPSIIT